MEPDLSPEIAAALWSPETGILDSHSFMKSLEKEIEDTGAGELVYSTRVVRVDPHEEGWAVQTVTGDAGSSDTAADVLLARKLINASGLSGTLVLNSLLPDEARIPMYYARGSYASYSGPGVKRVSHLLYPVPDSTGKEGHAFQSLGTHLTLDLHGKIRFGPDLEWIDAPETTTGEVDDTVFWRNYLVPDDSRLAEMHRAVTQYLPEVALEGMQPDYAGFRPKLVAPPTGGFNDFVFRIDYPSQFIKGHKHNTQANPMITLLGIESPGLTSSLAIAEMVVEDILGKESS
jgi:2-hydroxyglutarate dehydrogenase